MIKCYKKRKISKEMLFFCFMSSIVSQEKFDGAYVLESNLSGKENVKVSSVGNSGNTARGRKWPEDPYSDSGEQAVLKFVPRNENKYLIKSVEEKYLCAKPKDPGVVFCPNESDDNTLWIIKKSSKGYALRTKGENCLVLVDEDKREASKGFYLNTRRCKDSDNIWKIRKLEPKPKEEESKSSVVDVQAVSNESKPKEITKPKKEVSKKVLEPVVSNSTESEPHSKILSSNNCSEDESDSNIRDSFSIIPRRGVSVSIVTNEPAYLINFNPDRFNGHKISFRRYF
ncbi:hypothetical protein M153_1000161020 [Pseudoloma neurophilia]|uniref:Uncharacterized protein n=1 Tax=Pseudoloma neurophilia TaxID=146866 RepID=A0A0R0M1M9_9MICR|nr:hypothetical protein M153_1000161020 [Pseudoloma neurophilia]